MADQQVSHNPNCQSDGHDTHLCFMMFEGFHYKHPEQYRAMVQDAQFRSEKCARTANDDAILCEPIPL